MSYIHRVYFYPSTCQEVSCATRHDLESRLLPSSYPTILYPPVSHWNKRKSQNTLLLKLFLFFFFFFFERGLSTTYIPLTNKTTSHLTTLATREAEAMTWFKFPVSLVEKGKGERVVNKQLFSHQSTISVAVCLCITARSKHFKWTETIHQT